MHNILKAIPQLAAALIVSPLGHCMHQENRPSAPKEPMRPSPMILTLEYPRAIGRPFLCADFQGFVARMSGRHEIAAWKLHDDAERRCFNRELAGRTSPLAPGRKPDARAGV